jgi:hypothetical protein
MNSFSFSFVYDQLANFAELENFWTRFNTAFGSTYDYVTAASLRSQWQDQFFSQLPTVEVINSNVLAGARGTYDGSTNRIYLADSFVTKGTPEAIAAVLLEKIGDFVDAKVNSQTTFENQGVIFAEQVQASQNNEPDSGIFPGIDPQQIQLTNGTPSVSLALSSLNNTFLLHSNPFATKTIYLDFDGHILAAGSAWTNGYNGGNAIIAPAWSLDADPTTFNDQERSIIQGIWQRVAEDFAPFDVDVTTEFRGEEYLTRSSSSDQIYGTRALISPISSYFGSYGGFAYIDVFNYVGDNYKPALIFSENLSNNEKDIAEAITHEVGHNLGLDHDGTSSEGYYSGQGSGATGWGTIMGAGYYQPLTQWSKGEYTDANNTEDDLSIITTNNGFDYRSDDAGNTALAANNLGILGTNSANTALSDVNQFGIIEQTTDQDWFQFTTGDGSINLTIQAISQAFINNGGTFSAEYLTPASGITNLDIWAGIYGTDGTTLIAQSNPVDLLSASFTNLFLNAGTYYLAIDGIGKGDPLTTGYSDYGSLGQYAIAGTIVTSGSLSDQYSFTYYYGNGDSYSGYGYALTGTYYQGQNVGLYPNETGYDGYYTIDSVYSGYDSSVEGQVYVDSYYDGDTSLTNYSTSGYGYSGLGSESGTVYGEYTNDSFSNYNEADIPLPYTSVESVGNTALIKNGDNQLFSQVGSDTPVAVNRNGSQIYEGYAGWSFLAAETVNSTNQALVKHSSLGVRLWNFDSNWDYVSVQGVATSQIYNQETIFGVDADGDGIIGNPNPYTTLESVGNTALIKDGDNQLFSQVGSDTPITLNRNGSQLYEGYAGWSFLAAETVNSSNQVLVKNSSLGVRLWNFDSNWNHVSVKGVATAQVYDQESIFGVDADGDGSIGNPNSLNLTGTSGNDTLIGGANSDILTGLGGKDFLTGGLGSDRFGYKILTDSLLANFDVITDFNANASNDLFLVTTARSGFTNAGAVATLDNAGISAKLTAANFGANYAASFTVGSRTFVAINDAIAGFSQTTDAIVEVTGLTGTLGLGNFVIA